MANVNVRDLSIRFGANEVIAGLDLDVEEGEFLVLLGPSGCGKSTLLHSIAGLIEIANGSVEIGGKDMTRAEPSQRGIGMVFQSYALYPTMTVERNMSFGLRVGGLPRAQIKERVDRAARMLQLESLLARRPAQLSGGQRQRVAIGRALVREAGVFLFDEPLSNLDAKLRTELRRELKLLHKTLGSTMIYVTHDQVEAMTLATRIVVMRGGKVQQIGAPGQVYDRPDNLFVAGFLGAPGMNLVSGVLEVIEGRPRFVSPQLSVDVGGYLFKSKPVPGRPVILGFRPEHVQLRPDAPWSGSVQLVEPMGNHQVVWIERGGLGLSAVLHESGQWKSDDTVSFSIDRNKLSLFDQADESRL
ncbi:MAG TPA: ABC transporter ATP-binding protein [Albitalea sp.]|nr:ABC transporter ATP-binding protein [Albitalea sp.]